MSLSSESPESSGGLVPAELVLAMADDNDDDLAGVADAELDALAAGAFADSIEAPAGDVAGASAERPEDVESQGDPLLMLAGIDAAADLERDPAATGVADLDDDALLAAAAANQTAINTSQARQLALAAHWADLHNAEAMGAMAGRYGEGLLDPGGVGSPRFAEFAPAALAAVLGVSPTAATMLMADALDLRHRLPRLWERIQAGEVKAYLARRVAVATRDLSRQAAGRVDVKLATVAESVTGGRFQTMLAAAVAAADPAAARATAQQAARRRGVWVSREVDHGLSTLFARANAHDLAAFSTALDVVARALKTLGDTDDPDTRRAKAIGILGCPQTALDLVGQAEAARKAASAAAAARRSGSPDPVLDDEADKLGRFRFGTAVLHVHLSDLTLDHAAAAGRATHTEPAVEDGTGLVRVEDVGPILADQVQDWLGHRNVTVKPVIDLPNLPGVDGYETPGWLTEAVHLRTPADCSPYSPNLSRRKDIDHTTPYQHPGRVGGSGAGGGSPPPRQTRLDNLGPLTRANHRRKTLSGWRVKQPRSGVFVWRDPTGRHYLVDGNGTTPLGKLWCG